MARITVEDCIKQVRNQYDLVILAKERTVQLGRGAAPSVDPENDKKPVIALREIGESKIVPTELEESIVNKLRRIPDYQEEEDLEEVDNDTFRQMYQGGLSKSEMEKSATRKFTARVPRIEPKPLKETEEVIIDSLLPFITNLGIKNPKYFSIIRSELALWVNESKNPKHKNIAHKNLNKLNTNFRAWI